MRDEEWIEFDVRDIYYRLDIIDNNTNYNKRVWIKVENLLYFIFLLYKLTYVLSILYLFRNT
jgi:hypothetical protein